MLIDRFDVPGMLPHGDAAEGCNNSCKSASNREAAYGTGDWTASRLCAIVSHRPSYELQECW
jgi:hypothetical protein